MRHNNTLRNNVALRTVVAMLLCVLLTGALAHDVHAQSASQITPRSFEPMPQPQGGEIAIPESTGPEAPAGADQLFVLIGGVVIENGLPDLREQEQAVIDGLVGKRISVADLFAAARKLEQAYIAAGYGLVRVALPAQRLRDGATVHFIVINGYVERIDTSALPEAIRSRVDSLLESLVGRRSIRMSEIERALLLAGDLPGTALRSTLTPGSKSGAGVLVIEARYQPVTGFISLDNTLAEELGTVTAGFGLDANSVFGYGDQVYVRTAGRPGGKEDFFTAQPRNRTLAGGITIPLGTDGLTANLEVTDARTTPLVDDSGLGTTSLFTRYSARLNYPLVRARDLTVNLQAAFDLQQERVQMISPLSADISLDRVCVLRGSTGFVWFVPDDGIVTGRLTGSFGIGGRKAPEDSSDTPLSRQGADPIFQKLDMSAEYAQPLAPHLALDLTARAQTSFNRPMLAAEQFSLASASGLSPMDYGQFLGDSGYVLRGETQFPFMTAFELPSFSAASADASGGSGNTDVGAMLAPYLFGAYGKALLAYPTAEEKASTRGTAYGLGLRLGAAPRASFRSAALSLEYGCYTLSDNQGDGRRLTLGLNVQF